LGGKAVDGEWGVGSGQKGISVKPMSLKKTGLERFNSLPIGIILAFLSCLLVAVFLLFYYRTSDGQGGRGYDFDGAMIGSFIWQAVPNLLFACIALFKKKFRFLMGIVMGLAIPLLIAAWILYSYRDFKFSVGV
jgi:hypothetical protein